MKLDSKKISSNHKISSFSVGLWELLEEHDLTKEEMNEAFLRIMLRNNYK